MADVLSYWGVLAAILLLSLAPGQAISRLFRGLDKLERLSVSFGLSFLLIAVLSPLLALHLDTVFRAAFIFVSALAVTVSLYRWRRRAVSIHPEFIFLLGVFVAQVVIRSFVQILWEYPSQGGDWFDHAFATPWGLASGDWRPDAHRTTLFSVLLVGYHAILGTSLYSFWVSQLATVVVNSALVLPAFLIAHTLFGRNVARAAALFMVVNPFLFYQSVYTWPKPLATYFVLLAVYFLFIKRRRASVDSPLAGIFAGAAYLAHPLAVFYILTTVVGLAYQRRLFCRRTLVYFSAMAITVLPQFVWLYATYGTIFTSGLLIYPFLTDSWRQLATQTPAEVYAAFWATPVWNLIGMRIHNALSTLTYLLARDPMWYFFDTFPDSLTFPVYLLAVAAIAVGLVRRMRSLAILFLFAFLPFVFILLFWGGKERGLVGGSGLHPVVVILIILAFSQLWQLGDRSIRRLALSGVFAYAIFQCAVVGVYILRYYNENEKVNYFTQLGKTRMPVEGFDISRFVSAHFLLNDRLQLAASLFLVVVLIAASIIFVVLPGRRFLWLGTTEQGQEAQERK